MAISVVSQDKKVGKKIRHQIKDELQDNLSRLAISFSKARVSLKDINGDKGGVDKECKICVRIAKVGTLVVTARASRFKAAFALASEKLNETLKRRVSKKSKSQRFVQKLTLVDGLLVDGI